MNKFCEIVSPYNNCDVVKVQIASGQTFCPGDIIKIDTLYTGSSDNLEVYNATPINTVASEDSLAIVINQGTEVLADGRMPDGNPDISTYSFTYDTPYETITCIMLRKGYIFQISYDCIDNKTSVVPAVGVYLVPQTGDYQLKTASSYSTEKIVLKTQVLDDIAAGGQMGDTFIDGLRARVIVGF